MPAGPGGGAGGLESGRQSEKGAAEAKGPVLGSSSQEQAGAETASTQSANACSARACATSGGCLKEEDTQPLSSSLSCAGDTAVSAYNFC